MTLLFGRRAFWKAAGFSAAIILSSASKEAHGSDCLPLVSASNASLPPPWHEALQALIRATAAPGAPWACSAGTVELVVDPSGNSALLTIHDRKGAAATRRIDSPDDVVATGEALLAMPSLQPPIPPTAAPPVPSVPAQPEGEPRLLIQLLGGTRLSGPATTGWATGQLGGLLPFGAWSVAVWARYSVPVTSPTSLPSGTYLREFAGGFGIGRRLTSGLIELRASVDPLVNVVSTGRESEETFEGARVAFRIGGSLTATVRIHSIVRGVLALNGDFEPAGLGGTYPVSSRLPAPPAYSAGLLLGLEAVLR